MPTKYLNGYEIEYTAEPLIGTNYWGAYVAILAPSENPMHLSEVYAKQRVSAELTFFNENEAEDAASKAGSEILERLRAPQGAKAS